MGRAAAKPIARLPAMGFANAPCAFSSCRRAGSVPRRVLAGGGWGRGLRDSRGPPPAPCAWGLAPAGIARALARERARAWLARVGLAEFGARYPHMLSGGQRKRVGLVQVLIRDPKILLMAEPFGPLDAQTRQIMGNLLLDLWTADRKAVLFVTHDLEEAIALADRVVIMSASPHARIIGDWRVPLSRPRDISEVRMEPAFHKLHRDIWSVLKDEVMKGYAQSTQAPVEAA